MRNSMQAERAVSGWRQWSSEDGDTDVDMSVQMTAVLDARASICILAEAPAGGLEDMMHSQPAHNQFCAVRKLRRNLDLDSS